MPELMITSVTPSERNHFLLHLNAVIKDAAGIKDKRERERVIAEAKAMIDSKTALPGEYPCDVHDWIEKPELREITVVTRG